MYSIRIVFFLLLAGVIMSLAPAERTLNNLPAKRNTDEPHKIKYRIIFIWIADAAKFNEYMTKFPPVAKKYGYVMERLISPQQIDFVGVSGKPFEKPDRILIDYFNSADGERLIATDAAYKKIEPLLSQGVKKVVVTEGNLIGGNFSGDKKGRYYNLEMVYFSNEKAYKAFESKFDAVKTQQGIITERVIKPSKGLGINKPDLVKVEFFESGDAYKKFLKSAEKSKLDAAYKQSVDKSIFVTGANLK